MSGINRRDFNIGCATLFLGHRKLLAREGGWGRGLQESIASEALWNYQSSSPAGRHQLAGYMAPVIAKIEPETGLQLLKEGRDLSRFQEMPVCLWRECMQLGKSVAGAEFCPTPLLARAAACGEISVEHAMNLFDCNISDFALHYFTEGGAPIGADSYVIDLIEGLPTKSRATALAIVYSRLRGPMAKRAQGLLLRDATVLALPTVSKICQELLYSAGGNDTAKASNSVQMAITIILARPDVLDDGLESLRCLSRHSDCLPKIPETHDFLKLLSKRRHWDDERMGEDYRTYERADRLSALADYARLVGPVEPDAAVSIVSEISDQLEKGIDHYEESRPHTVLLLHKLLLALPSRLRFIPESLRNIISSQVRDLAHWPTDGIGYRYPRALPVSLQNIIIELARVNRPIATMLLLEARWMSHWIGDEKQRSAVQLQLKCSAIQLGCMCPMFPTRRRMTGADDWLTVGEIAASLLDRKPFSYYSTIQLCLKTLPESRAALLDGLLPLGWWCWGFYEVAEAETDNSKRPLTVSRLRRLARRAPESRERAGSLTQILKLLQ